MKYFCRIQPHIIFPVFFMRKLHTVCALLSLVVLWCRWILLKPFLPGLWFNIKMPPYQCRKSHCGDKIVLRSSYLHNGISFTSKMTSFILNRCPSYFSWHWDDHIDGLVQERRNSSALAMELRLSCTNPSIYASASGATLKNMVKLFKRIQEQIKN